MCCSLAAWTTSATLGYFSGAQAPALDLAEISRQWLRTVGGCPPGVADSVQALLA
ncbi:MAG: hypothetical protein K9N23_03540 [Akkermansiaceae bacterium]|nr:hypothetical protein [Akkermansiaceae bacterium]MCF7730730.1 hypothetical protein [Akkermansiaceae bacterium]